MYDPLCSVGLLCCVVQASYKEIHDSNTLHILVNSSYWSFIFVRVIMFQLLFLSMPAHVQQNHLKW